MPTGNDPWDGNSFEIHLLDVGTSRYGDCTLCRFGDTTILIDGGHAGDYDGKPGHPSIPQQLETLLGHPPPFDVSLLIVTHCHGDHIGCLPKMVRFGDLSPLWALVADERLGYGLGLDEDPHDFMPDFIREDSGLKAVLSALQEEPFADALDVDLEEFLADAYSQRVTYETMLGSMEAAGTQVVRYGRDDHNDLVQAFSHTGLTILGPSPEHLLICAELIARQNHDAVTELQDLLSQDAGLRPIDLYRQMVTAPEADAMDSSGTGAAKNDQSIVLTFDAAGYRVLLPGDMQFAEAQVSNLDPHMDALREAVAAEAPFDFARMSHHASYNGLDESVLGDMGDTTFLGMSGGTSDPGHPSSTVLSLLRENHDRLQWVRTDKNGLISIFFDPDVLEYEISRGRENDWTKNVVDLSAPEPAEAPIVPSSTSGSPTVRPPTVVRSRSVSQDQVEVHATIPHLKTRVNITIEVEPSRVSRVASTSEAGKASVSKDPGTGAIALGNNRVLPNLVLVTNREGLRANIGRSEAEAVLEALEASGHRIVDLSGPVRNARSASDRVREHLGDKTEGVLIVGGYDIVPSQRLDSLSPTLRRALPAHHGDSDDFIVWSDDIYGCLDNDGLPEVPVSRIPDARSPQLVAAALGAGPATSRDGRYGIRNSARPFAEEVFDMISGQSPLLVSAPTSFEDVSSIDLEVDGLYFMLHGADVDATRFWGEDEYGICEAINIGNVPRTCKGVVFTGCCWGALTTQQTALRTSPHQETVAVRPPEASLALSFLKSGAWAFVGCTGTHYSPTQRPFGYFGGPMHRAFWSRMVRGIPPAKALFEAKLEYIREMPHGLTSTIGQAIEMKILRQFTCLGLGW